MGPSEPAPIPDLEGALCVHRPDLFGVDPGHNDTQAKARAICNWCPVLEPCREWALTDPSIRGVAGGMTWLDRAKLKGWRRTR